MSNVGNTRAGSLLVTARCLRGNVSPCAAPETKGFVNFNGAVERHPDGGLVMAYRNYHNHDDDSVEGNGNVTVQASLLSQASNSPAVALRTKSLWWYCRSMAWPSGETSSERLGLIATNQCTIAMPPCSAIQYMERVWHRAATEAKSTAGTGPCLCPAPVKPVDAKSPPVKCHVPAKGPDVAVVVCVPCAAYTVLS